MSKRFPQQKRSANVQYIAIASILIRSIGIALHVKKNVSMWRPRDCHSKCQREPPLINIHSVCFLSRTPLSWERQSQKGLFWTRGGWWNRTTVISRRQTLLIVTHNNGCIIDGTCANNISRKCNLFASDTMRWSHLLKEKYWGTTVE